MPGIDRRRFLRSASAITGAGGVGALAGCTGSNGTKTTAKTTAKTVKMSSFPINIVGLVWKYTKDQGILEQKFDEAGYDVELNLTFKGAPLFLSGKVDISNLGAIEAARAGVERDLDLTVAGKVETSFLGPVVKKGGKWDPANTGSVEASIQGIAESDAQFAIIDWAAGNVPAEQIVLEEGYDLSLKQNGGDFSVVTASPPSIPKQLMKDRIAAGTLSPSHGIGNHLMNDKLRPLYWEMDKAAELGLGLPPLANLTTRTSFYEENKEALRAAIESFNAGAEWFFESGLEDVPGDEEYRKMLGASSAEAAEWTVKWIQRKDVEYAPNNQTVYQEVGLTDEWISSTTKFLNAAKEIGQIPEGWTNNVTFAKV